MIVYRIAKWQYLDDLAGTGARLYGGRWNYEGHNMLYTSAHLSLAVLELLANQVRNLVDNTYGYIKIEVPEEASMEQYSLKQLPDNWREGSYTEETLQLGTNWLKNRSTLALKVPSAVLMQETNILINPSHQNFQSVRIVEKGKLELDGRI